MNSSRTHTIGDIADGHWRETLPERESLVRTFEEFCRAEYSSMANALTWSLGGHDLGREAADEAFARAFERWETVGAMGNPAGWVYRVGMNWGRRRLWRGNRERELLTRMPSPEIRHIHYHDPDLASALADLPVKHRSVVVLRLLLDYSERDTAEALGISVGTVKSRLHRGLTRLRQQLDDPNADDNDAHPVDTRSATNRTDEEQSS